MPTTKYIEPMHRLAESLRNHGGKALPAGVSISRDGRVNVPLAILMGSTRVNYVPIDWVCRHDGGGGRTARPATRPSTSCTMTLRA